VGTRNLHDAHIGHEVIGVAGPYGEQPAAHLIATDQVRAGASTGYGEDLLEIRDWSWRGTTSSA
jgi:hypothetical protein